MTIERGQGTPFATSLVWSLAAPSFGNPVFAVVAWIPPLLYSLYHVAWIKFDRISFKQTILFTGTTISLWLLLNAYWTVPAVFFSPETFAGYEIPVAPDQSMFRLNSPPYAASCG